MYYWRCWQNTRIVVLMYLMLLIAVTWDVFRQAPMHLGSSMSSGIDAWHDFSLLLAGLGFAAWILGSLGIGRDIAEGTAAYFLSRPRSRGFFVMADSAVVFAELIILSFITMALFMTMLHFKLIYFGVNSAAARSHIINTPLPLWIMLLVPCSMVLFAGLFFSVTYLMTVLVRSSGVGIFLAAAAFISYLFLQVVARSMPEPFRLYLPSWMFNPFDLPPSGTHVALYLALSVLSRAAVILAILYGAKLIVEHVDIRA